VAAEPGTIIVLNGAAGAGKSSIVRAYQALAEEPHLDAGLDRFLRMLPPRFLETDAWPDVMGQHDRPGATGRRLASAMHRAIGAIATSGMSVVADHVVVERGWLADMAEAFERLPAYLVGVVCPREVLEERERARDDRQATIGEAARQAPIVHTGAAYDLEVDTSRLSAEDAAQRIRAHVQSWPPRAFRLLRLFEGAPDFCRRLISEPSRASWDDFLAGAQTVALAMPEQEQVELLNAHPRIGAAPSSVSALSYHEQGYDRDPATAQLQERLGRLNDEYERRFGFRFVIFVAGRSRTDIADVMERHLDAERSEELRRGLGDVIAIARDRAARSDRHELGESAARIRAVIESEEALSQ
jgi:chloramphenicol 3-O-phosphotransferase/2-oxo-4-hydroxy-4-carboxy--5-ureidoimidazoline (OHCU) decarboxylase